VNGAVLWTDEAVGENIVSLKGEKDHAENCILMGFMTEGEIG